MLRAKLLFISGDQGTPARDELHDMLDAFCIVRVASLADAQRILSTEEIDCALVADGVPEPGADELLAVLHRSSPMLPVVFWDPEMSANVAVRLLRAGAHHCFGYGDTVASVRDFLEALATRKKCKVQAAGAEPWRATLIGESRPMEAIAETIRLIASRRCTVLISGETGTGKEVAARALHMAGSRASQPFVAVNCSALPENLLEAELFGHVKGAFTGAVSARMGRFEQANKGTLFLDEIGEMPIELQAKLLRVLQDRVVQRLGTCQGVQVDVRVIAASNANLLQRVREGKFREDLYYRLAVVPLEMSPLRDRTSDIPLLVRHFVKKICFAEGLACKRVTPDAMERLSNEPWKGNVRQLENAVEMAIALSGDREVLHAGDFRLSGATPFSTDLAECMDFDAAVTEFKRRVLDRALERAKGNKTAAASLLGMNRTTFVMKLRSVEAAGAREASLARRPYPGFSMPEAAAV